MKKEIKNIIENERKIYIPHIVTIRNKLAAIYTHCEEYEIFRFMCHLRLAEYYMSRNKIKYIFHLRRVNIIGGKLGYFISPGVLGKNVVLYHRDVIINLHSVIGDGCIFHGDNCVGNNGKNNDCPELGKKVELGIGAKVIGGIHLADNIIVGANSVVTKSFDEAGITIAGIPAKKIQ